MARIFTAIAWLVLPRGFLEEYGRELEASVQSRLRACAPGWRRVLLWARELVDLLRTAAGEWRSELSERAARTAGGQGSIGRCPGSARVLGGD